MKVLFITSPADTPFQTWYPPLGIAYISSFIKQFGYETACCDAALGESPLAAVKKENPDLIGITCTTLGYMNAVKIAKKLKEHYPDIPIVLGGQHISALPHTLKYPFDSCVVGEGERAFLRLCSDYISHGSLAKQYSAPAIANLDELPFPDRDMYSMKNYLQVQSHFEGGVGVGTSIFTSRGCLYRCIFCSSARFWGAPVRGHSAEYILDEMQMLVDKYGIQFLNVFDDLFQYDKQRLRELAKGVKDRGLDLKMAIQAHAPTFDEETAELCAQIGVKYAGFGLESASPRILKMLKCGVANVDHARTAIRNARKFGMKVGSGFMYGVPTETKADRDLNQKFVEEEHLDSHRDYILTPYPGTPLWEYAKKKGLVSDDMDFSRIYQTANGKNVILQEVTS